MPIGTGSNTIQITATDPAGNVNTANLTLRRGTGKLTAALTASIYQIRVSKLPEPVTLSVTVTDPDGRPLEGASVTFTLARARRAGDHLEPADDLESREGELLHDDPEGRFEGPGLAYGDRPHDRLRRHDRPHSHQILN